MTTSLLEIPLREWIDHIVPDVFESMLSVKAVPAPRGSSAPPASGEQISGAIGIAGENLTGAIYLHLSLPFAREITALLLGTPPGEVPGHAEINDLVGEFCNMVSGNFKSSLADHGTDCAMSPPSIIRGSAFAIEAMPDAHMETFHFDCLNYRLVVEIHLHQHTPVKILSIDDSKIIRMIVGRALKNYDCVLCEAANGEEGLAAAASEQPDLIILDITMPVMDGVTMLTKMREDPALKAIPVIMLTAESGRENVAHIARLGVRDYLVKPFKEEQLIEKIVRIVPLVQKAAA